MSISLPKSTDLPDIVAWMRRVSPTMAQGFLEGLLGEMRRTVDALVEERAKRDRLLARFVDDNPCRFDHHGDCQEHIGGNPCAVDQVRKLLGIEVKS